MSAAAKHRCVALVLYESELIQFDVMACLIINSVVDLLASEQAMVKSFDMIAFVSADKHELVRDVLRERLASRRPQKPRRRAAAAAASSGIPNVFKLISNSQDRIDKCKAMIEAIVSREIEVTDFEDDYLDPDDKAIVKTVEKICHNNRVVFKWNFESKKIRLSGSHKNVSKAQLQIAKSISDVAKSKHNDLTEQMIAQKVQWQMQKNNTWRPFNMFLNTQLEVKYDKYMKQQQEQKSQPQPPQQNGKTNGGANTSIRLLDEKNNYFWADVKTCELAYEDDMATVYEIRRTDVRVTIKFPDIWSSKNSLDLVTLSASTDEYVRVLDKFNATGIVLHQAISIQRIENRCLYTQYQSLKEFFENKFGLNHQVERTLFHGTSHDCVNSIWKTGFNRSYAGKNATAYGKGVYFALNASYSHLYTDLRHRKGPGHMFLCKVLVGNCAIGHSGMSVPPPDMDTTVDNTAAPSIFVIYKDAQAYPEYLLTYN